MYGLELRFFLSYLFGWHLCQNDKLFCVFYVILYELSMLVELEEPHHLYELFWKPDKLKECFDVLRLDCERMSQTYCIKRAHTVIFLFVYKNIFYY